jgi:hypothetical protein
MPGLEVQGERYKAEGVSKKPVLMDSEKVGFPLPWWEGYNSFLPLTLPHLWEEAGGGKGRGSLFDLLQNHH